MAKSPPPIVYLLAIAALGGGGWYAYRNNLIPGLSSSGSLVVTPSSTGQPGTGATVTATPPVANPGNPAPPAATPLANPPAAPPVSPSAPVLEASLPDPLVLQMDGSVTMVRLIKGLQNAYGQRYPNTPTTYGIPDGKPNGSNKGLQSLLSGQVQIAATSRPLNATEVQAGIRAIPIAKDAIAIVVGIDNPFKGGLTMEQLSGIFQGKITSWSQVGGPATPIKVLNRAPASGTYDLFQSVVLLGQPFPSDGPNFKTFTQDVTTPILQELKTQGISYTTVAQAEKQQTIRIVPINGSLPTDLTAVQSGLYPLSRSVFLAVPQKTSPVVKNWVDLALSPLGQQIARQAEFTPLQ